MLRGVFNYELDHTDAVINKRKWQEPLLQLTLQNRSVWTWVKAECKISEIVTSVVI